MFLIKTTRVYHDTLLLTFPSFISKPSMNPTPTLLPPTLFNVREQIIEGGIRVSPYSQASSSCQLLSLATSDAIDACMIAALTPFLLFSIANGTEAEMGTSPTSVVGKETRTTTEDETTGMHIRCDSVVSDASLHIVKRS